MDPLNAPSDEGELYDACIEAMLPIGEQRDGFVPESDLRDLVCERTVVSVLKDCQLKVDINMLTEFVCNRARKTFAILAMMGKASLIQQFYLCEPPFTDDNLPIRIRVEKRDGNQRYCKVWRSNPNLQWEFLHYKKHPFLEKPWSTKHHGDFSETWQWSFVCPVFRSDIFEYKFHERIRLPFVDKGPASVHTSNFSDVEERRIHHNHLQCEEGESMVGVPLFSLPTHAD
jgi:hypothetical protein